MGFQFLWDFKSDIPGKTKILESKQNLIEVVFGENLLFRIEYSEFELVWYGSFGTWWYFPHSIEDENTRAIKFLPVVSDPSPSTIFLRAI